LGRNGFRQIGNGQLTSSLSRLIGPHGVSHIAARDMSMAVTDHRIVLAWGENSDSQLGLAARSTTDVQRRRRVVTASTSCAAIRCCSSRTTARGGARLQRSGLAGDTTTTRATSSHPDGLAGILGVTSGAIVLARIAIRRQRLFLGDNSPRHLARPALAAAGTATRPWCRASTRFP